MNQNSGQGRPWKGVLFPCCGVYGRLYQNLQTGIFLGNCPRCLKPAKIDPRKKA